MAWKIDGNVIETYDHILSLLRVNINYRRCIGSYLS